MPAIANAGSFASTGARGERVGGVAAEMSLPHAPDVDRRLAQRARALGAGDDDREAAVRHQAAVEEVERLHDPARGAVVVERERLGRAAGRRVQVRPAALRDGDRAELILRRAVDGACAGSRPARTSRSRRRSRRPAPSRARSRRPRRSSCARPCGDGGFSGASEKTQATVCTARRRSPARRAGSSRTRWRRRGSWWR